MKDYVDEVMSKRIESLGTNSMFNSLVVLFPSNSSNYYPASQIDLNNLLKALKSKKYSQVNITGYADMSGNKDVNLSLSKSRANKVSEFLINNGVDPKVIKTEYWGETSQFDKSNLVNNRRVEINIEY
jgi:outer membrane protein OmpA-like peptidoglycan-associated protein